MNRDERALLIGMILGDGNLYKPRKMLKDKSGLMNCSSKLTIKHSHTQKDYLEYKIDLLHSIFGRKRTKSTPTKTTLSNGKTYLCYQTVKSHTYFNLLHRWIYPQGQKIYTRHVLDMMTPQALAIWFMDDGNGKFPRNKQGSVSGFHICIATYCPLEEALIIRDYFKEKWDIEFKMAYHSRFNSYYMRANTKEANKFINLIKQYVIPSMQYKIDPIQNLNWQERRTTL